MDTNPTVNNMSKSNKIGACIYIFEIRNKNIPFPFLFFSVFSFSCPEFLCFYFSLNF